MKISLEVAEGSMLVRERFAGADHAIVIGVCPKCQHEEEIVFDDGSKAKGFKVAGKGRRISNDDRSYESDAVALCCEKQVGTIRAKPSTLFGLHEDEAVLQGRYRVY